MNRTNLRPWLRERPWLVRPMCLVQIVGAFTVLPFMILWDEREDFLHSVRWGLRGLLFGSEERSHLWTGPEDDGG